MERKKSKVKGDKLGDMGLKDLNLRPVSGGLRRCKAPAPVEIEDMEHASTSLPNPSIPLPKAGQKITRPDTLTSPSSGAVLIKGLFKQRFKREDFVVQLMEEGMIEAILDLIGQVAQFYLRGLPATKVIDELAKYINRQHGTQQEINTKIAIAEQELQEQLAVLKQLQQEHDELRRMEEVCAQKLTAQTVESSDTKHITDDKQKKLKAAQKNTTPRKK